VFTLDAHALVTATSSEGQTLWTYDLTPARDRVGDAGGGGLAFGENKLFVTSGYGTLTALDPKTGLPIWVHDLNAGGTGTPSVNDGVVYVVAGDAQQLHLRQTRDVCAGKSMPRPVRLQALMVGRHRL
jgi:outer membrane protein assembly factor BamB